MEDALPQLKEVPSVNNKAFWKMFKLISVILFFGGMLTGVMLMLSNSLTVTAATVTLCASIVGALGCMVSLIVTASSQKVYSKR